MAYENGSLNLLDCDFNVEKGLGCDAGSLKLLNRDPNVWNDLGFDPGSLKLLHRDSNGVKCLRRDTVEESLWSKVKHSVKQSCNVYNENKALRCSISRLFGFCHF